MAGGVNYTLAQNPDIYDAIPRAEQSGRIRLMKETYADGGDAGDVVYLGDKLPVGAVIVGIYIKSAYAAVGATIDIGDADDPDRYIAALDSSVAVNGWQAILEPGYTITEADTDDQIQMTIAGATVSGAFTILVLYAV